MITAVKDLLAGVLNKAGIPRERIAHDAREEQTFSSRREAYPFASLVSDPGRFEVPDHKEVRLAQAGRTLYRQIRIRRVLPVVVKITAENEEQAGEAISRFIAEMPFEWEYQGIKGEIEPTHEEYSDYDSRMHARYEAAVVVEVAVDVGPMGNEGRLIAGVNEGEGRYEE